MQITLRQLEIFAAICQEASITRAARRVGLSQAATSQALAELENQLQRRLFDRHGRRIAGNAAGRDLLPAAIEVLDRVRDIEAGAGRRPLNVKLYASLTVANYMLPSLIARFSRRHPDALFHLAAGNTDHVVRSVRQFESDAGVCVRLCSVRAGGDGTREAVGGAGWRPSPPLRGCLATVGSLFPLFV